MQWSWRDETCQDQSLNLYRLTLNISKVLECDIGAFWSQNQLAGLLDRLPAGLNELSSPVPISVSLYATIRRQAWYLLESLTATKISPLDILLLANAEPPTVTEETCRNSLTDFR